MICITHDAVNITELNQLASNVARCLNTMST